MSRTSSNTGRAWPKTTREGRVTRVYAVCVCVFVCVSDLKYRQRLHAIDCPCHGCRLEEAKEELDDFQESSRALETELEAEVELGEKRIAELQSWRVRHEQDNDALKVWI